MTLRSQQFRCESPAVGTDGPTEVTDTAQPVVGNIPPRRLYHRLAVCGFLSLAALVLTFRLGSFRLPGSHELLAIVPAEQMLHDGDWIVPRYGQLPRLEKPPLGYWLLAGSGKLCGELTAFTARLPAAVSALLLTLLLMHWAGKHYGRGASWACGFVMLSSIWLIVYARKAEVDMFLCLLTTSAIYLVAEQPLHERGWRACGRAGAVMSLVALSWLAKFHYGPAMILAPAGLFWVMERRWRPVVHLLNPLWLAVLAAAVFVWPMLLLQQVPDAMSVWGRETVGRAVGVLGAEPVWYYLPKICWLTLPWAPFWILGLRDRWRAAWAGDPLERFLWIWLLSHLLMLTLSAGKHKHYLMATLPVASLWSGRMLWQLIERVQQQRWRPSVQLSTLLILATLGGGMAMGIVVTSRFPAATPAAWTLGIGFAVIGSCGFLSLHRGHVVGPSLAAWLNFGMVFTIVFTSILPRHDPRGSMPVIVQEMREHLQSSRMQPLPVCLYRLDRVGLFHHLQNETRIAAEPRDSSRELLRSEGLPHLQEITGQQASQTVWLVTYNRYAPELRRTGAVHVVQKWPCADGDRFPTSDDLLLLQWQPHKPPQNPAEPRLLPEPSPGHEPLPLRLASEPQPSRVR